MRRFLACAESTPEGGIGLRVFCFQEILAYYGKQKKKGERDMVYLKLNGNKIPLTEVAEKFGSKDVSIAKIFRHIKGRNPGAVGRHADVPGLSEIS